MSQYRFEIHNGVLYRFKRKLLRAWLWRFNRSEEDRLNKLKNKATGLKHQLAMVSQQIPFEEARINKIKDGLKSHGPRVMNDVWSARTEPVILQLDRKTASKKSQRSPPARKKTPGVELAVITTPPS